MYSSIMMNGFHCLTLRSEDVSLSINEQIMNALIAAADDGVTSNELVLITNHNGTVLGQALHMLAGYGLITSISSTVQGQEIRTWKVTN